MTVEEVNEIFLSKLKTQIDKDDWSFYFTNIKIIGVAENKVLIHLTDYIKSMIDNYLIIIQNTVDEIFNKKVEIIYTNEEQNTLDNSININKPIKITENLEEEDSYLKTGLSPQYTFDNFVIGDNCNFAANAGIAISKTKGPKFNSTYNPLLLYGGVGLGKTHLIQAIGNGIYKNDKTKKIIYTSAENLMNEFTTAIANNTAGNNMMFEFKSKYRTADVLLIDDIHFFENKNALQEELFCIFNALHSRDKQIVFTCDRPIEKLKNITDRLRSRFGSGTNIDLHPPQLETRIGILKRKFEEFKEKNPKLTIEEGVYEYVAEQIETNVRELEGNFKTIVAYSELVGNNCVTLKTAKDKIQSQKKEEENQKISYKKIMLEVCNYFDIKEKDLCAKRGSSNVSQARLWYYYLVDKLTDLSRTDIGNTVGKQHPTVTTGIGKIKNQIAISSNDQMIETDLINKIYDRQ